MNINDQNPILNKCKTTLSNLGPVALGKHEMALVWFLIEIKTIGPFWNYFYK